MSKGTVPSTAQAVSTLEVVWPNFQQNSASATQNVTDSTLLGLLSLLVLSMKEIVHIRAGNVSNFVGTHYFNTLESYFASENNGSEEISHSVSFRDGIAPDGTETFCPRLLLFDYKAHFGALSNISALYGGTAQDQNDVATWYVCSRSITLTGTNALEYQERPY